MTLNSTFRLRSGSALSLHPFRFCPRFLFHDRMYNCQFRYPGNQKRRSVMSRPDQFIPHLVVTDGAAALQFYQEVFGAKTGDVMIVPQGTRLMHGEIIVDGHMLFVSDEFPEKKDVTTRAPRTLGGTTTRITIQTDDYD